MQVGGRWIFTLKKKIAKKCSWGLKTPKKKKKFGGGAKKFFFPTKI